MSVNLLPRFRCCSTLMDPPPVVTPEPMDRTPFFIDSGSTLKVLIPLLALMTGCDRRSDNFSIQNALDPNAAAPVNHWATWRPRAEDKSAVPDLKATSLIPAGNSLVDLQKTYALSDMVDLGLRSNPVTRSGWESARAAAAGLGMAEGSWLPIITANLGGGYWRYPYPAPGYAFALRGSTVFPTLEMAWTLFDKSRSAKIDQAEQQLFSSSYTLNRTHQKVSFEIQRSFYSLLAARAQVKASEMTVKQATWNTESIRAQQAHGLATQPEYLLAVQDQAKAGYELQTAHGLVMEQQAALAEYLGITPDLPLKTITIEDLSLPDDLEKSADLLIDEALEQRPDLAAKVAEIRAKDAEIRKAEATYWPTVNLGFQTGWKIWDYANVSNNPQTAGAPNVKIETPLAAAYVQMSWNIFEGFSGVNAINKAEATRNVAQAEFDALQLKVMREVWKNYADFKIALRKRQFALAMLKASENTYEASTASFQQGLVTVIELITAERNLAAARYTEIDSKRAILDSAASLLFSAGSQEDQKTLAFDQSLKAQQMP